MSIDTTSEATGTAAQAGAGATARFRQSGKTAGASADQERVSRLAGRLIRAVNDTVLEEKVTYDEYNALKAWLIKVGEDGEWPLFLDVWVEHSVEEVANANRHGSKGTIEGPYYVPDSPAQQTPATLPMRQNEPGTPLLFQGQITSVDGEPLKGGKVEIWHADDLGFYSQFAPGLPEWNLRGTVLADDEGHFQINTVQPAPYQIPPTARAGSSSPRRAGTRGAPPTSTSRSPPRATSSLPRSCTSRATRTTTTTSPRPSSPSSCSTSGSVRTAEAGSPPTTSASTPRPERRAR